MYGNGLLCSTIWRSALPVPDSVPAISVRPPGRTGFWVAASESPSGWRWVVNVRSAPRTTPRALRATSR